MINQYISNITDDIKVRFDIQQESKQGPNYKPFWQIEYFYSDRPITETEIKRKMKELFNNSERREWVKTIFIEEVIVMDKEVEDDWEIYP